MIGLATALLLSAAPPPTAGHAQSQSDGQTVVVTGVRIPDYRARLKACLERDCPPDEDIEASLALAEALFLDGDYSGARRTIRASLGRNRGEARGYPEPVSDLYRAHARVSRHLGFDRDAALAVRDSLRALQAGLPVEDHRHFTVRLEIAQSLLAFGRYREAEDELRRLAELARKAGREDLVATAELRRLWVNYAEDPAGPTLRKVTELSQSTDPALAMQAPGARMLLARIYRERGETEKADALAAGMGRATGQRQLIYAPVYDLSQISDPGGASSRSLQMAANAINEGGKALLTSNLADRLTDNFDDKWIDVSFWITPEGRVEALEVVRRGKSGSNWAAPLLRSIAGRRYSPDAAGQRTHRLERYTYTSEQWATGVGSRIGQRSPSARVEYLDLTAQLAGDGRSLAPRSGLQRP
ncbi:MAG TPA: hypothetical protein VFQ67_00395 [Allosphingosinicella sp.]|jgi:tetratricopeptide (TPR) repeat protein|nr:hypothetical protein [Allosphingosinicella sp.]